MSWTLSEIRQKTRQLSGRLSVAEIDNDQVDEYVNKYFQFEFPAEVKLNRNYTLFESNTEAGVQNYAFPVDYTNFVPEATIDRRDLNFYQNPDQFYSENPQNVFRDSTWTGDAVTTAFTNTFSGNIPIIPGTVIVDDTVEVFTDDGAGVLTGDLGGAGTVNYITGVIAATFITAPTLGQVIQCSFIQAAWGVPTSVLMFNNQFTFFPVPDRAYRFRIKAWSLLYVQPAVGAIKSSFTLADDRPVQQEWGPSIALGAARRICSDWGEMDRYQELTLLYKEQIGNILTRTHIDLESTRVVPTF